MQAGLRNNEFYLCGLTIAYLAKNFPQVFPEFHTNLIHYYGTIIIMALVCSPLKLAKCCCEEKEYNKIGWRGTLLAALNMAVVRIYLTPCAVDRVYSFIHWPFTTVAMVSEARAV